VKKIFSIVVVCAGALLIVPRSASAQGWSLDLGYQFQRLSFEPKTTSFPLGFAIGGEVPIRHPWSIVGHFDWSHRTREENESENEVNLTSVAGGIRWTRTMGGATPFVHGLFGAMHSTAESKVGETDAAAGSDTDPMLQVGGGVAVPISGALKGVAQADYRRIFHGQGGGVNAIRLVVGGRWSPR